LKFWSKILFPLLTMFALVTPASAQKWTMPGKGAPVPCTTCVEPAKGKLTYPFNEPIVRHVGRYVDSSTVGNVQNLGTRTVRARKIRSYPDQNRLAVALGEGVGLYKLDTFFSGKLPQGMVNVDKAFAISPFFKFDRYADPLEKVLSPDAFFYAECNDSHWVVKLEDSQLQLIDYDMDDRGYFYVSTITHGWGIAKDNNHTGAKHLDFVMQNPDPPQAEALFSLHVGSRYYLAIVNNDKDSSRTTLYDVTAPTSAMPRIVSGRTGYDAGVVKWEKHDATQRLAILTPDSRLVIYDYAAYVGSGTPQPLATYTPDAGHQFADVSFDEDGRLWVAQRTSFPDAHSPLWKLSPSGTNYVKQTFDPYGTSIVPSVVQAAGGYIAVIGSTGTAGTDVVLMKVEGGTPQALDLHNFFRNYYSKAPAGYVALDFRSPSYFEGSDVQLVEQGNKVYLMYSAGSLGDVFELAGGNSISVAMTGTSFGTANPNSRPTETGPFYGDILKFKATTSALANYSLDWDFGNPESGNADGANSGLNEAVEHQFTGLQTAAAVVTPKPVKAQVVGDASISDTLNVTLKLPKARIGIPTRTAAMTTENKSAFEVVAGDQLTDASDGVVEGHFSGWSIDNVEVKKLPTATMDVGALGNHSLAFTAYYGAYNSAALVNNNAYKSVINNVTYSVKPFIATILPPVNTATEYVFNADARVTALSAFLSATQWTVTWSIENTSSILAAQTVNVGVIPEFRVAKSGSLNGKTIKLQITVDPLTVPSAPFATYTTTQLLDVPDIQINKTTGCINAGEPCTLTAVPAGSGSNANWQLSWTIKRGSTTVKTGTSNPVTFTPEQGIHTVSVTETAYGVTKDTTFTVAAATCGPLPALDAVDIGWSCASCQINQEIDFEASVFPNTIQPCHQFVWDFGDGGTGTGQGTTHTYARNSRFTVKVTIKTATSTSNTVKTEEITIGGGGEGPVCTLPTLIDFSYTGNQGCSSATGVACKTGEVVTFSAKRGIDPLQTCDTALWTVDGTQYGSKSPKHTFTTTGNKSVSVTISNTVGAAAPVTKNLNITPGSTGSCNGSATADQVGITFAGDAVACGNASTTPCALNDPIEFTAEVFEYVPQACDVFEWNFGDGTPVVKGRVVVHGYTTPRTTARVTLRVYNTVNTTGVTKTIDVPFPGVSDKPAPVLGYAGFPTGGAKGVPITFNVAANINATGWSWDFNDGSAVDNSQNGVIGKTTSITHTFTKTGTFNVRVTARNSEAATNGTLGIANGAIVITDTPEFKYLLPVVTHIGGLGGSVWRTDVQIYNPDPNVSPNKPLVMTAMLRDISRTLEISDSTYIYEDFMNRFTSGTDSGPVIITTRSQYAPQIWTRTYNQTESGTFGQFIPAIRLDAAGGGAAAGTGKYFLAGLRANLRYRTNVGLVNPTTNTLPITVSVYDDTRLRIAQFTKTVGSFQAIQFNITEPDAAPGLKPDHPFSIEFSVPDGQWLIAYTSFIDGGSNDPVYLQAVRESELTSSDFRTSIVPGVGHIGSWRSDVTIFNPNFEQLTVDLAYYDQGGVKRGEALAVPIRAGEFLQYDDLLKQGIFGNVVDSLGMLRVAVPSTINTPLFPMTFARTYNDNGGGKTYGQGIRGFAAARANVKPGKPALIPGVRKNSKYRTNLGLINVSDVPVTVTAKVLDPASGGVIRESQFVLKAFESIVAPDISLEGRENASIRVEVTGGNAWAFTSQIDSGTQDPEYIEAIRLH
jgi:PKD repeat protein